MDDRKETEQEIESAVEKREARQEKSDAQLQFEKMTQTPVSQLVVSLGIPTTISMLITNLYNMADTFFVSKLGTSASGATGIVFALMAIIQAFGFMLGHGAGSNISRHLGAGKIEDARKYASTSFFLSLLSGLMITVVGFCNLTPLMHLLGSTETILPYAKCYATYILIAAPALAASCVMNNILRYEGKAMYAMVGLTSGGILNIFGDMFLMFGLHMGIAGAGLSTAVSQYISAVILMIPFLRNQTQSKIAWKYRTKSMQDVWNICAVGFPSMVRQGLGSISVMVLNLQAAPFGDAAIAAMSIVSRVINFLFCVGLGIGQGFQPVSGFNYGAGKYRRVRSAFFFTLKFGEAVMTVFAILGFIGAPEVIRFFRDDSDVINVGTLALRLQCVSLICLPVTVCCNMLFQSVGKSGRATFLASTRSGLFFIPTVIILGQTLGILGIQLAQPVADVISAVVSIPFMLGFFRRLPYQEENDQTGSR